MQLGDRRFLLNGQSCSYALSWSIQQSCGGAWAQGMQHFMQHGANQMVGNSDYTMWKIAHNHVRNTYLPLLLLSLIL